ncbi:acetate non-utilizing protein 9 [Apophysomyces sp. BC1034]|nr:acetate non-utilizing protein 9 [Apophysomyces sp. BC1015]KAG0177689.1 acetate non-utilizing protein 9 [Apophysomyces sp. BC1021]KAG0188013.1 acetate non-utilizing protein 9 [Apophysomyces sp. BC1034]
MTRGAREVRTLLAPLVLYREILRVHRYMPPAMRAMGDDYVKAEFRRHKDIDNPAHIVGFVSQWQDYLDTFKTQTAPDPKITIAPAEDPLVRSFNMPADGWGRKMDPQLLEKMSDEQLGQLYELRSELKRAVGVEKNE